MSSIYELETNIKAEAAKIDLESLTKKLGEIEILYNGIVPLINEAVLSASNKSNFEEAYKAVIDKLREIHERISEQKRKAQVELLSSVGKKEALQGVIAEVSKLAQAERDKVQKQRVE